MEWELSERSRTCAICSKKFEAGANYNSALFLDKEKINDLFPNMVKNKELKKINAYLKNSGHRVEFCPDCWREQITEQNHDISWKGEIIKSGTEETTKKFNKQEVLSIFKQQVLLSISSIEDGVRFDSNNIAYFLAIMLERKNVLIFKEEFLNDKGINCVRYEISKTEESFILKVPFLSTELMNEIQEKVFALLNIEIKPKQRKKSDSLDEPASKEI